VIRPSEQDKVKGFTGKVDKTFCQNFRGTQGRVFQIQLFILAPTAYSQTLNFTLFHVGILIKT